MEKSKIKVNGHRGTWYIIDQKITKHGNIYLLEHEQYGDEVASLIIDENKNILVDEVYNGFLDYEEKYNN